MSGPEASSPLLWRTAQLTDSLCDHSARLHAHESSSFKVAVGQICQNWITPIVNLSSGNFTELMVMENASFVFSWFYLFIYLSNMVKNSIAMLQCLPRRYDGGLQLGTSRDFPATDWRLDFEPKAKRQSSHEP